MPEKQEWIDLKYFYDVRKQREMAYLLWFGKLRVNSGIKR